MDNNNMNFDPMTGQPVNQAQQTYGQQPVYQQPVVNETVSLGEWMLTYLLMLIPIVNIVMLFVWAFGNSKESKKNWARATLIWYVIAIVIGIALGGMLGAALGSAMYY
ncbi:MAG: hypothetical protein K6E79_09610 [Pseudobutyrivibrio sp.]|nr:hypothetical protein [Pseudobutyrivibrio sp.]